MPRLYLIRHGEAAAGWSGATDPGLSPNGQQQAEAMASHLAEHGPLPLLCSPLARTRETAAALARRWDIHPVIEARVGEIPSPRDIPLEQRMQWLRELATRRWTEVSQPQLLSWREHLLDALCEQPRDSVIVSHFMAINAAAGAALGDDRVVHFSPGYCAITVLESSAQGLRLIRAGDEAPTRVL